MEWLTCRMLIKMLNLSSVKTTQKVFVQEESLKEISMKKFKSCIESDDCGYVGTMNLEDNTEDVVEVKDKYGLEINMFMSFLKILMILILLKNAQKLQQNKQIKYKKKESIMMLKMLMIR